MTRVFSGSLYGTLNLLVLQTVAEGGSAHGLEIARRIRDRSEDGLKLEEGALYPALHRLEREGLLEGEWGRSESNRRAKYYALTPAGRERLEGEVRSWLRHTAAVCKVLDVAWTGPS